MCDFSDLLSAIILCPPVIRLYLINYARPLIYTTFMSYPSLIAIKTAYSWLQSGKANLVGRHFSPDFVTGLTFSACRKSVSPNRPSSHSTSDVGGRQTSSNERESRKSHHTTGYLPRVAYLRHSELPSSLVGRTLPGCWIYCASGRCADGARGH